MEFLDFFAAPTPYHAAAKIAACLKKNGYEEWRENDDWGKLISRGKKAFVQRGDSAVIAFDIPKQLKPEDGMRIGTAHTDCPLFRLRLEDAQSIGTDGRLRIPTDVYGGTINATWLDRPLAVAGIVAISGKNGVTTTLVDSGKPLAIIPNPAPHLQRNLNSADFSYDARYLAAIFDMTSITELLDCLSPKTKMPAGSGAMELYLYDAAAPQKVGDLLSAQHLDNLTGCWGVLQGLTSATRRRSLALGCFFNNEEVGSNSSTGATGSFLTDVLQRLMAGMKFSVEDTRRLYANSWMASVDAAHAFNANTPELFDAETTPVLNGGIALKTNVNLRYATTCRDEAMFRSICEKHHIPWHAFQVPTNAGCGSTVGPTLSAATGIPCADIGIAMWAMHSIRETIGLNDMSALAKFMTAMMA